ncbi:MAG: NAD(P)/FAD-dependent oxidoreductase, partial [Alphaproteobacteria bacterium]|nr:NAD(P)/FAD-dependent oxidoreductase [Alphaproteobacteria bacterium]
RNHPGFPDGVRGRTLLARMRRQAEKYGARIEAGDVEDLRKEGRAFRLSMRRGEIFARTVLLATGVVDIEPALPGVDEAVARGLVRICPICDGYETIGRRVGVIGRDAHAAREAIFVTTYTPQVALILIGAPRELGSDARRELEAAGVEVLETPLGSVKLSGRRASAICFGPDHVREFDSLYSALGVAPRTRLAIRAGAKLDEAGRLLVGERQETSVSGLYAAGDVVRGLNQISTAEGEGATAATAIHNQLRAAGV